MSISGTDLLTESVKWWNVNMASSRSSSNGYSKWSLLSAVARVMYNYADRYMITGTFRADGSSKFTNDKWGYFPSVGVAWNLGNEAFMQNQNIFSNIKLRASYGVIGNEGIDPYSTLGLLSQTGYAFGGTSQYTGFWIGSSVATPDLTWETTNQLDLGVDFGILDGRLQVSADYFDKRTKDGLLQRTIPNSDGGGSYWINAAKVKNQGFDFSLDASIIETSDWNWNSTFTATYLKNEVTSLGGLEFVAGASGIASGLGPTDGYTRVKVGEPIGSFYGYRWAGLDDTKHDTYEDLNNDNVIDSNDRDFIGKANPDWTFGWNNQVTYKNWELSAFFTASIGAQRLNAVKYTGTTMTGDFAFKTLKAGLNEEKYPPVTITNNNYQVVSTKFIEDADYLRLTNLSLSYLLPKTKVKFADVRFTLSCQNLFTITGYSGMDPAGTSFYTSGNGNDVNDGLDFGAYPLVRSFTFGVRFNF